MTTYFLLTSHSDGGQVALLDGSPVRSDSEIQGPSILWPHHPGVLYPRTDRGRKVWMNTLWGEAWQWGISFQKAKTPPHVPRLTATEGNAVSLCVQGEKMGSVHA